jgi:hypothetical protein
MFYLGEAHILLTAKYDLLAYVNSLYYLLEN